MDCIWESDRSLRLTIRSLRDGDVPAAADLVARVLQPGTPPHGPALEAFLRRRLLDAPSACADVPSLVGTDGDGRVVGLIGVELRPMTLNGRPVRLAYAEHAAVDPDARGAALGALLLRRLLMGPQDATLSDTANASFTALWLGLGGHRLPVQHLQWIRVLRPWALAAGFVAGARRLGAAVGRVAPALDALSLAASGGRLRTSPPGGLHVERLTRDAYLAGLRALRGRIALRPNYDAALVDWLFAELDRMPGPGRTVRELVRGADGRLLGWYIYRLRLRDRSDVLHLVAGARDTERVLDQLVWHAGAHGAAALVGRLEPRLVEPLRGRGCIIRHAGVPGALVHTRDEALRGALLSTDSLVSRFDGQWTRHAPA